MNQEYKFHVGDFAIYDERLVYIEGRFRSRLVTLFNDGTFHKKHYYDASWLEIIETKNPQIPHAPKRKRGIINISEENLRSIDSLIN